MLPSNQTPWEKEDERQEESLAEKDKDVDFRNSLFDDGERDSPEEGGYQEKEDGPELFHGLRLIGFRHLGV